MNLWEAECYQSDASGASPGAPQRVTCQLFWAWFDVARHDFLDFVHGAWKSLGENLIAVLGNKHVVLNAHAEIFFRDVNPRLDRDDHSGFERAHTVAGIVHVKAQMMADAVGIILAECVALFVAAVGIDVIGDNLLQVSGPVVD